MHVLLAKSGDAPKETQPLTQPSDDNNNLDKKKNNSSINRNNNHRQQIQTTVNDVCSSCLCHGSHLCIRVDPQRPVFHTNEKRA